MQIIQDKGADAGTDQHPGVGEQDELEIVTLRSEIDQCGTSHEVAEHLQDSQSQDDEGNGAGAFSAKLVGVDDNDREHDQGRQQAVEKGP